VNEQLAATEIAQKIIEGVTVPDYPELLRLARDYKRLEGALRTCGSHISWALAAEIEGEE
jgi:hypothetical protein